MRCLSNIEAEIQTWKFTLKGWNFCQGPNTYIDTQAKSRTDDSITFNLGAGTLTIKFGY